MTVRHRAELDTHRVLHLARTVEEMIRSRYSEDEMKTPMHMSWGQEACAVGLSEGLGREADFFSTYRSHALFVARTRSPYLLFSELLARSSSPTGGVAGSMHLSSVPDGLYNSSAIVGGNISVAVGSSFASKLSGDNRVSAAIFGDGALDTGVLWESFGLAMLFRLPMLFVCEDNGFAVHAVEDDLRNWGERGGLKSVVEGRGLRFFEDTSGNVHQIVDTVSQAAGSAISTQAPVFLRLTWTRVLEHVGVGSDFTTGWRAELSETDVTRADPIEISRRHLELNGISRADLELIENENLALVAEAYENARCQELAPRYSSLGSEEAQ